MTVNPAGARGRGRTLALFRHTRDNAVGEPGTTYRFEATGAEVRYFDAVGDPIAIVVAHRTAQGWQVAFDARCAYGRD